MDFFNPSHIPEPAQKAREFGINDGNPHATSNRDKWAYTTTDGESCKWNAHVTNEKEVELQFVPLDHNITEAVSYTHLLDLTIILKGQHTTIVFVSILKIRRHIWHV